MTTQATASDQARTASGPPPIRGVWRQYVAAARVLVVLTVLLGMLYPLGITVLAQLPGLRDQAGGSLVRTPAGTVVGSSLLGQGFVDADGSPLPQWFQPRPSAAGARGWDGAASGGSNLGPDNPALVRTIEQRKAAIAAFDSVPAHPVTPAQVPADAVTASASALDPHISPAYARQQAYRVAAARGLDPTRVLTLVADHIERRTLGFLGQERVNVLVLNLALEAVAPQPPGP